MILRDIHNNIGLQVALGSVAIVSDTTTVGLIIDLQAQHAAEIIITSGVVQDGAYAVLIEEGDAANLSDAAAVADTDLLGTEADAGFALTDDATATKIGYIGTKRYIRLSVVSTATTNGGIFSAVAVVNPTLRGTTS